VSVKGLKISRLVLIALCVFTPLLGWLVFGERGLLHLYRAEIERQEHMDRIRILTEENKAMMDEIERLRNDMKYIEHLARKELNMVKENETVYRFGDQAGTEAGAHGTEAGNDANPGPGRPEPR